MRLKKVLSLILVGVTILSLTGCGSVSEISELNDLTALNAESNVKDDFYLSYTDEQELIYAQVSNRQLLNLSALTACTDNEIQQVLNYMEKVDSQLIGNVYTAEYDNIINKFYLSNMVEDDAVIDSLFTDYLLTFFEQSPFYWQRSKTVVRGIDSNSRSIIVDVTYETIDYLKTVKGDSHIVRGVQGYDTLVENRYMRWIEILDLEKNNKSDPTLELKKADFMRYYGDPLEIIAEQSASTPTVNIYNTGNQVTYNGLINSDAEKSGGVVTVRYILVPEYVMGINLGISCKHMYILDYNINKDVTSDLEVFNKEGYATVTDSVYNLIYSYFTCMDESDFTGLYKLTSNFGTIDKYYKDLFESTYMKHDGFSVSLFNITGTHVTCGVTISTKERAKGTEMTFPVYTDRYFMELELVDDKLKVNNMVLLSRKIEGEPAITSDNADTTGFSAIIDLDNDDKVSIEKLICDFSAIQLLGDTSSDDFSKIVDISITTNQLATLQSNMTTLKGEKKVVFLENYQQGTSNYASVKCKELYQKEDGSIVEAEVTYEFILKGNKWYVYNYVVNSTVTLDAETLIATNSLCLVSPGKVESYTSQIKGSVSTDLDDVADASKTFEHEHYTPNTRLEDKKSDTDLLTGGVVSEGIFNDIVGESYPYSSFDSDLNTIKTLGNEDLSILSESSKTFVMDLVAVIYNKNNSLYTDEELTQVITTKLTEVDNYLTNLNAILGNTTDETIYKCISNIVNLISSLKTLL